MFKTRKYAAALLSLTAVLLALAILSGCGIITINDPDATTSPDTSVQITLPHAELVTTSPDHTQETHTPVVFPSRLEEAQARLDALMDFDLSDDDIVISVSTDTTDVIFPTDTDPLYVPRTNRNLMINGKYGCDTLTVYFSTEKLYSALHTAHNSGGGDFYSNLLVLPALRASTFYADGLLFDLRALPFTDTEEGCTAGNIGKSRYFVSNAVCDTPEHLGALYFNRTMLGEELSRSLADTALVSTLTYEDIFVAASSVNDSSHHTFSTSMGLGDLSLLIAQRENFSLVSGNETGSPTLSLTESRAASLDSLLSSIVGKGFYTPADSSKSSREAFADGEAIFYFGTLDEMSSLYDKPIAWGLLPFPVSNADAGGEAIGVTFDSAPVLCVPKINQHYELTSLWINAASAASGDWMRDQYLAVAIEKYMRDNDSCLVLQKILSFKVEPKFETIFSSVCPSLDALRLSPTSSIAGGETIAQAVVRLSTLAQRELDALK